MLFGKNPTYGCCNTCGMIYATTVPADKDLLDYYQNGPAPKCWAEQVQQNHLELMLDKLKFRWALELAGWPKNFVLDNPDREESLCDIGCSTGTLLEVAIEMLGQLPLARERIQVRGIDVNHAALETAQKRLDDLAEPIDCELILQESIHDDYRSAQLVTLWEVLEHVVDPGGMMETVKNHLPMSGPATVLICVPNAHSLAAKVLHEKAPMFGMGHFNIWGPTTLQLFLQRHLPDFTVEFRSIISWVKEIANHYQFKGPFDADRETFIADPAVILKNLEGYKLVAIARRA
jgi:2-polyprenyl-3-methyl-5-hydroxy-6-metoxy-1,4-benzoquinol methylase